jgi:hypothetical protein
LLWSTPGDLILRVWQKNATKEIGRHCERSEAIQPLHIEEWIASSLTLLARANLSNDLN